MAIKNVKWKQVTMLGRVQQQQSFIGGLALRQHHPSSPNAASEAATATFLRKEDFRSVPDIRKKFFFFCFGFIS